MTTDDAPTAQDDGRKAHFYDIVTGIFGLVLALSAFSITTASLDSPDDVWQALAIYTPAFFLVLGIWQIMGDLFDRYPSNDPVFYVLMVPILFLTTLAPAFLNLLLSDAPSVQRLSATLFPVAMAGVFALLTGLWLRLARLAQRHGHVVADITENIVTSLLLALLFLASLLLPYDPDGATWRTLVWFTAFLAPIGVNGLLRWRRR